MPIKVLSAIFAVAIPAAARAQPAPSAVEIESYAGLRRAAHEGNLAAIVRLVSEGADLEARDGAGRTPIQVAAFASNDEALAALANAGADMNAIENRADDVVTIGAVADSAIADRQGVTPLQHAIDRGCDGIAALVGAARQ